MFAERTLHLGYSIDARYRTIAKTSTLPDMPAGYITDADSIKLLIDRLKILRIHVQKPGGLGQDLPWVDKQSRSDMK